MSPNGKGMWAFIGIDADEGFEKDDSEIQDGRHNIETSVSTENYTAVVHGIINYSVFSYSRTIWEKIPRVDIGTNHNDRKVSGEIVFNRLGPGVGQTDVEAKGTIKDNHSIAPITHIITGDYRVRMDNVFCGCSFPLSDDHVVDTRQTNADDDVSRFKFPKLEKTEVSGRLVAYNEEGELEPLPNQTVKLIPACAEADDCMRKVEDAVTNIAGVFVFNDVPKGGYKLVHKNKVIKEVSNCVAAQTSMDLGDILISVPYIYDIRMIFDGGSRSRIIHADVIWKDVQVRPVDNQEMISIYAGGGTEDEPLDTNGEPLMVPFELKIGLPFKQVLYGIGNDVPELKYVTYRSASFPCRLDSSEDAPNGLYMEYGDYPGVQIPYPRPLGHHLEMNVYFICGRGEGMQESVGFMTGRSNIPDSPDDFNSLEMIPDDMLDLWKRCESFEKNYTNKYGSHFTLMFECKGPDKRATASDCDPSNPNCIPDYCQGDDDTSTPSDPDDGFGDGFGAGFKIRR
jgi:hypothetical protein